MTTEASPAESPVPAEVASPAESPVPADVASPAESPVPADVASPAELAGSGGSSPAVDGAYARQWASAAAAAADERKGEDTVVIDVGDVLVVTDLFVITHGNNARQVRSITEGVEELVKQAGGPSPLRIEGADDRQWVLLDYGPFVVHVFDAERRALYQLERLWGDCPRLSWEPAPVAEAG